MFPPDKDVEKGIHEILFSMSEGDLSRAAQIEKRKVGEVYRYYYMKRVNALNEKRDLIAYKKHLAKK